MPGPISDVATTCNVKFFTNLPEKVPDQTLAVPSTLTTEGFRELVNHVLNQDPPVAYDFLINSEYLETSLSQYIESHGLTAESVINVEYVLSFPAPEEGPTVNHPDWIACVRTSQDGAIMTGCYDNVIRVWSRSNLSASVCQGTGHTAPVKTIAAMSNDRIISGSKDRSLRLWKRQENDSSLAPIAVGLGHTDAVESVATCPDGSSRWASGGWDACIRLWLLKEDDTDAQRPVKKPRKAKGGKDRKQTSRDLLQMESVCCISDQHTQTVTSLCWPHPTALYSTSWDRTMMQWDASQGSHVRTWNIPDAASCMAFNDTSNLIAVGHSDRVVRLYDPRAASETTVKTTLRGHSLWVVGVAWRPQDPYHVVSCSHDRTLRIWDVRATSPLHTLRAESDAEGGKTLAVDWSADGLIACGGTDGQLRLHNA